MKSYFIEISRNVLSVYWLNNKKRKKKKIRKEKELLLKLVNLVVCMDFPS